MLITHVGHRRSTTSQGSHGYATFDFETDVLTDQELKHLVDDLKQHIRILNIENDVLERTINRLDPSLMHGVYLALEYAMKIQSSSSLDPSTSNYLKSNMNQTASKFGVMDSLFSPSKISPSRMLSSSASRTWGIQSSGKVGGSVVTGPRLKINLNERSELVTTEMQILKTNIQKESDRATKRYALFKAQFEEIEIRIQEIEKESQLFTEEVITQGYDRIIQRIPAEVWVKFISDSGKKSDRLVGKLRLRTSTLNNQYHKLKQLIQNKSELSEELVPVDFEKLKIENGECVVMIEEKMQQLEELKQMTGDANLMLAMHKDAMYNQDWYLGKVIEMTKRRGHETVVLDKEIAAIQVQVDRLTQQLNEVRKVRMDYELPDIMEYVYMKNELGDLEKSIKRLECRAHIKRVALMSIGKKMRKIVQKRNRSSSSNQTLVSTEMEPTINSTKKIPIIVSSGKPN